MKFHYTISFDRDISPESFGVDTAGELPFEVKEFVKDDPKYVIEELGEEFDNLQDLKIEVKPA